MAMKPKANCRKCRIIEMGLLKIFSALSSTSLSWARIISVIFLSRNLTQPKNTKVDSKKEANRWGKMCREFVWGVCVMKLYASHGHVFSRKMQQFSDFSSKFLRHDEKLRSNKKCGACEIIKIIFNESSTNFLDSIPFHVWSLIIHINIWHTLKYINSTFRLPTAKSQQRFNFQRSLGKHAKFHSTGKLHGKSRLASCVIFPLLCLFISLGQECCTHLSKEGNKKKEGKTFDK